MRYLLIGAALAAIAAPATARDHSFYFGIEAGALFPRDTTVRTDSGTNLFRINYKTGVDGDLIFGYDFGLIRAEMETSHKWAKYDSLDVGAQSVDGRGHTSGFTEMGNVMLDFGRNEGVNFYVGGGAGLTWLHQTAQIGTADFDIRDDGAFAWQGIAGVRAPVFRYFDIGLKYRYFNAHKLSDNGLRGRFRSHSVLASLIYNFNAAEVAPPPPPPPPPEPTPERGY